MLVNEQPAFDAGLSNEAEDLAFILLHRCSTFERATGDCDLNYRGDPVWGDGMRCTFTCSVCGAVRKVQRWNDYVDWYAVKIKNGGSDGRGHRSSEGEAAPATRRQEGSPR